MPIITIDGPAGVGKSTIAKLLAKKLLFAYLDTGAMYRTLALNLSDEDINANDLYERCKKYHFELEASEEQTKLFCNGVLIGSEIRNEQVGARASKLGTFAPVRRYLQEIQKELGKGSLVAEGRDMGLKVFPDAQHKFFLEASPEIRAMRRYNELPNKEEINIDELATQIKERDFADRTRKIDPLMPAQDANIIDTSNYNIDQVLNIILEKINNA